MPRQITDIDFSSMMGKIKSFESKKYGDDDKRFYTPKMKEDGTFEAIVRFLPAIDTDLPYVKVYSHWFKGSSGKYYKENCPTSIGKKCPVCEDNTELWNSGGEQIVRDRKSSRKLSVISNIYIVQDPQQPENEGKVFLWRYPKDVFTKIMDALNPSEGGVDKPINVFHYKEGANFKISLYYKKVDKNNYLQYDKCMFKNPSPIAEKDEDIQKIDNQLINIASFIDEGKNFKTYEELSEIFNRIINVDGSIKKVETKNEEKKIETKVVEKKVEEKIEKKIENEKPNLNMVEESDPGDFFKKLQGN